MHVMIHAINAREPHQDAVNVLLTLGVNSVEHLQTVTARLMHVPGVERIERTAN